MEGEEKESERWKLEEKESETLTEEKQQLTTEDPVTMEQETSTPEETTDTATTAQNEPQVPRPGGLPTMKVSQFYGPDRQLAKPDDVFEESTTVMSVTTSPVSSGRKQKKQFQFPMTMDMDEYMEAYEELAKNTPPSSTIGVGTTVDYVNNGLLFTSKIVSVMPDEQEEGSMLFFAEWAKPKDKYYRSVGMTLDELIVHIDREELALPDLSTVPRGNARNKCIEGAPILKAGDCVTTVDGTNHIIKLNYEDLKVLVSTDNIAFSYLKLIEQTKPATLKDLLRTKGKKRLRGTSPASSRGSASSAPAQFATQSTPDLPESSNRSRSSSKLKKVKIEMVNRKVGPNTPMLSRKIKCRRLTLSLRNRFPSRNQSYQRWLHHRRPSLLQKLADGVVERSLKITTSDSLTMQSALEGLKTEMKNDFESVRLANVSIEKKVDSLLFASNQQTHSGAHSCLRCTQIDRIAPHSNEHQPSTEPEFRSSTPVARSSRALDPLLSSAAISSFVAYDETDIGYDEEDNGLAGTDEGRKSSALLRLNTETESSALLGVDPLPTRQQTVDYDKQLVRPTVEQPPLHQMMHTSPLMDNESKVPIFRLQPDNMVVNDTIVLEELPESEALLEFSQKSFIEMVDQYLFPVAPRVDRGFNTGIMFGDEFYNDDGGLGGYVSALAGSGSDVFGLNSPSSATSTTAMDNSLISPSESKATTDFSGGDGGSGVSCSRQLGLIASSLEKSLEKSEYGSHSNANSSKVPDGQTDPNAADGQPHELLSDWTNPMPREQPNLQIRQWTDYTEVKFTGDVQPSPDWHIKAVKLSASYAKSVIDQMEKKIKKGTLKIDQAEKKKRAVSAKWVGYVNSVIKLTTGFDPKVEPLVFIEEGKSVTSDMVKYRLKSTVALINHQPKPISTALEMCWTNVFAVHKKTVAETEIHDIAVKNAIKKVQAGVRQGRRKKRTGQGEHSGSDDSANSSFFEDDDDKQ